MILNKITISNEKKRNTKIKIRFKTLNLRVLTRGCHGATAFYMLIFSKKLIKINKQLRPRCWLFRQPNMYFT